MAVGPFARPGCPTGVADTLTAGGERILGVQGQTLFLCCRVPRRPFAGCALLGRLPLDADSGLSDGGCRRAPRVSDRSTVPRVDSLRDGDLAWSVLIAWRERAVSNWDVLGVDSFWWLAKYAFWMGVFLLAVVVVARVAVGVRLANVLAGAVIALGLLRAGEGVLFGALGNAKSLLLQQNAYGWAFSTFFPFAVWFVFRGSPRWRWATVPGLCVLSVAIAINGSRASWAAVVVGALLTMACLFLWASTYRAKNALLLVLTMLGLALASAALPSTWMEPITERWGTLAGLDRDKSYAVRSLMVEKAALLFERSPGSELVSGRFTSESVPLELPPVCDRFPRQLISDARRTMRISGCSPSQESLAPHRLSCFS